MEMMGSMTGTDTERVKAYLAELADWDWSRGSADYIEEVVMEMAALRRAHPDGNYPVPIHDLNEVGACPECDARRVLGDEW